MRNATKCWLAYAQENLDVAVLCMANGHGNACVQNAQQCVEKALKAVIIEQGVMPEKTHRTSALLPWIRTHTTVEVSLTADEVDRVDTVYIPSKYPISDALPNGPPTQA